MKSLSHLILLFCVILGSSQTWAKRGSGTPGQDFRAFYIVPVISSDLLKFAIFSNVEVEYKNLPNNVVKIEYILPLELTGVENNIELEGVRKEDGSLSLIGNGSTADCAPHAMIGRCEMIYKNIEFDPEVRSQILNSISKGNNEELQKRLLVAEEFQRLVTESQSAKTFQVQNFSQSLVNDSVIMRGDSEIHGILEVITD